MVKEDINNEYDKTRIDPTADVFDKAYFEDGKDSAYLQGYEDYVKDQQYPGMVDDIAWNIKPKKFLDIGCAYGYVVERFVNHNIDAYGIDISEYAITHANEDIKDRLAVINIENENIPFQDGEFDFIICLAVIEHLHDDSNLLKEIKRLLTDDGMIYLTTPPKDYERAWLDKTHINLHYPDEWIKKFRDFGFVVKPLKVHQLFGRRHIIRKKIQLFMIETRGKKLGFKFFMQNISDLRSMLFLIKTNYKNKYTWAYILKKGDD